MHLATSNSGTRTVSLLFLMKNLPTSTTAGLLFPENLQMYANRARDRQSVISALIFDGRGPGIVLRQKNHDCEFSKSEKSPKSRIRTNSARQSSPAPQIPQITISASNALHLFPRSNMPPKKLWASTVDCMLSHTAGGRSLSYWDPKSYIFGRKTVTFALKSGFSKSRD